MRYLTAFLKIAFIFLLLFISSLIAYTYFSGDEIKKYLLKEINQQLLVQTDVAEVDISLFQNFPNFSLILKGVHMHQGKRSLVKAEEIRAKFNLSDLLDQRFELHSVSASNGEVYLTEDESGNFFPTIWKKQSLETEEEESSFRLKLKKIGLQNIQLFYSDIDASNKFDLLVSNAWARGDFQSKLFEMGLNAEVEGFNYYLKNKQILIDERFRVESSCRIENGQNLAVESIDLMWKGIAFHGNGNLDYKDKVIVNLDFQEKKQSIAAYMPLFPEDIALKMDSMNVRANIQLNGSFKGELSPRFHPSITIDYVLTDGKLNIVDQDVQLTAISTSGTYVNPNISIANGGQIRAENIQAKLNKLDFNGNLSMSFTEFSYLQLDGSLKGELIQLQPWLKNIDYSISDGEFESEIDLLIPFRDLKNFDWSKWKQSENSVYMKIENGAISSKNKSVSKLNAELALGKNDLFAKALSLSFEGMEITFDGKLLNLISFLDSEDERLLVDGNLSSEFIDLDKLLSLLAEDSSKSNKEVALYLNCQLNALKYEGLNLTDLRFDFRSGSNGIGVKNIELNALQGSAKGEFYLVKNGARAQFQSNANISSIDIHQLFEAFNNFGQTGILAENLYGKASGAADFAFMIDEHGEVDTKSLALDGFIDIREGKLVKYEPLYKLSNFIELKELEEIQFKQLQNQIKIENEEIYIPRFEINSSALNLQLEGKHSFDNVIDYRISLLLDQVLGKKAKKPVEKEFGYVEDDGLGRTQLFLKMTGNLDNPDISYDRSQLKDHWKKEVQNEKREIKSILKEEFGLFKKDSSLSMPNQKQAKKPLFEIEWGENEGNDKSKSSESPIEKEKKSKKKGKFGKFIDKIAKPNEEEYVYPQD